MRDGLYRVHFRTPAGQGMGIVVLENGTLRGGDAIMYYVGSFSAKKDAFTAELVAQRHNTNRPSVFGVDTVNLTLEGTVTGDTAETKGTAKEKPDVAFQATLTRLAD
jgi:hypothetical protein